MNRSRNRNKVHGEAQGQGRTIRPRFIQSFRWLLVLALALTACKPERTEIHRRPTYYQSATNDKLPDQVVLDDGTIVKYKSVKRPGVAGLPGGGAKPFELREERPDGSIVLHALLPEHVLVNTLTCIRNEEYQLMWDQMLAQRTKRAYVEAGQRMEDFIEFLRKNRHELAESLNRMVAAVPTQQVSFTPLGEGVTRCQLRPQIAGPFKYKKVDVVSEDPIVPDPNKPPALQIKELKLLMIH